MGEAAQEVEEAWTVPGPAPETTCLMQGPAATTPHLRPGGPAAPGALMRTAAEEEGAEATNHQATRSTNQDRNLELEGTTATMTPALVLAPVSSSESSSCETEAFFLKSIYTSKRTETCDIL